MLPVPAWLKRNLRICGVVILLILLAFSWAERRNLQKTHAAVRWTFVQRRVKHPWKAHWRGSRRRELEPESPL